MKKHQLWKSAVLALSMLLFSVCGFAQTHDVTGKVLDEAAQPIPGANVVIKGTTTGTITAANGQFSLKAADGDVLVVSYIGYVNEEVTVSGSGPLTISLVPNMEELSEVVVVGYGVQKKSDVTGAIASVRSEDLERRSSPDALQAMQGKAAGVTILNSSAAPGSGADIRVRGYSSNSGNLGPLMIVDGLKVDNIQYLDPAMIESMEILKDAASAAIYGAEAGNGVVLITTKSGKKQDGKIFYNFQYSQTSLGKRAKMMNAEQYINWQKEAGNFTDKDLENWGYDGKTDTDWSDVIFGKGATQRHTVGFQGGNDRGNYYLAITNLDDDGIVKGSKDVYKRLSAQLNADYKIKDWLTVSSNTSIEKYKIKSLGEHNEYAAGGSIFMGTTVMDPITPVYYESDEDLPAGIVKALNTPISLMNETDTVLTNNYHKVYKGDNGKYYAVSKVFEGDALNPLILRDRADSQNEGINIRGTFAADFKPIKGLVATSRFGYRITQAYNTSYSEPYYANSKNFQDTYSLEATSSSGYYYQWENFINYGTSLGAHDISAMAGMSYIEDHSYSVGGKISGVDPLTSYRDNFRYLAYANPDDKRCVKTISGGTPNQSGSISYFGRLAWSYANKYNLQANFRADAFDSSKLSANNRWGKFPSVSAGWTLSNEDFLADALAAATISYLKVRASWGQNGNISVLQNYPYSVDVNLNSQKYQFDINSNTITTGSFPNGLANPDLKWETSEQIDLGIDGRLLDDKLSFAIDYYKKTTKDLLVNVMPKIEVGASSTTLNAGEIVNSGFEFELGWKDKIGDFSYSVNANAATLKNEVTYVDPTVGRVAGGSFADHTLKSYFEEGYSVWHLCGYVYEGVDTDNPGSKSYGKAKFKDVDGDGSITVKDQVDLGSGMPTFTYGLTINLSYKNFDLAIFGTGVAGNKIYACNYRTQHPRINAMEYFYRNRSIDTGKIGGKDKDYAITQLNKFPSAQAMKSDVNFWSSTANLFDGDYFKIKQIQLGYTVPQSITSKIAVDQFRVFVSLDDFFTFTKYEGFDPEVASSGSYNNIGFDKGSYPTSKKVTFGVNLSF